MPVPLPSIGEQHEITRRVEALFALADAVGRRVAAARTRAEALTQSVLAQAFRGELVPTEAELARQEGRDYEPAPALLERVRNARSAQSAQTRGSRQPVRQLGLRAPAARANRPDGS